MIRLEVQTAIWRWREVLLGLTVLILAGWWAASTYGGQRGLGIFLALSGCVIALAGVQRGRFRRGNEGAGVVRVVEGQIQYFGPLTGGAVALSKLVCLTLDRRSGPPRWVLSQPGVADLEIPVDALGAETLFDAFSSLPDLQTEYLLSKLTSKTSGRAVVWNRNKAFAKYRLPD